MHSDPGLVQRLLEILPAELEPRVMFGGQCWMLNGNMCVGVYKEFLITRIGVDALESIAKEPHVHPMDITGKPMKGWAKIAPEGIERDESLYFHIEQAIKFASTLPSK